MLDLDERNSNISQTIFVESHFTKLLERSSQSKDAEPEPIRKKQ